MGEARERGAIGAGPVWLFGPKADALVFGGSAAVALSLVALRHALGFGGELPAWAYVAFILGIDVAHVYATLFRTYFDRTEFRRYKMRYVAVPVFAYGAAVWVHRSSPALFWTLLAYLAVFHFVRQQAGWVALYRGRSGAASRFGALVDSAAIYAATLYPILYWHAHLSDRKFVWFVRGDFADISVLAARMLPLALGLFVLSLGAFVVSEVSRAMKGGRPAIGKSLVVAGTAATWYVGIVLTNSDFDFTVTNVITHGAPYIALLFAYARARAKTGEKTLGSDIANAGFGAFFAVITLFSLAEETGWDRWIWHDRPWLFGGGTANLGAGALTLVVPLLATPQITHYVLDGILWRRKEPARRILDRAFYREPSRAAHGLGYPRAVSEGSRA